MTYAWVRLKNNYDRIIAYDIFISGFLSPKYPRLANFLKTLSWRPNWRIWLCEFCFYGIALRSCIFILVRVFTISLRNHSMHKKVYNMYFINSTKSYWVYSSWKDLMWLSTDHKTKMRYLSFCYIRFLYHTRLLIFMSLWGCHDKTDSYSLDLDPQQAQCLQKPWFIFKISYTSI